MDVKVPDDGWWSLRGRIGRGAFLMRLVVLLAVSVALLWAAKYTSLPVAVVLIGVGLSKAVFVFQCVKRAHDFGMGNWTALLALVPFVDAVWLLPLIFVPGSKGTNAHGPRPSATLQSDIAPAQDRERDRARLVAMVREGHS